MKFSIAQADQQYANQIMELVIEWGYPANQQDVKSWLDALNDSPNHKVLIALSENVVAGWIVFEKRIGMGVGFTTEITGLSVSSRFRRMGIGHKLAMAAEQWSLEQGISNMVVCSNITRKDSHAFYPSIGYQFKKKQSYYIKPLTDN